MTPEVLEPAARSEPEHPDRYQRLRARLHAWLQRRGRGFRWAELLLLAPDLLHLLVRLGTDPAVPLASKARLAAAVAYFVSPIDVVPEGLVGPAGYLDDVALAAYVLNDLLARAGPELLERHWAGPGSAIKAITRVLEVAESAIGAGVWRRVKAAARQGPLGDAP